MQPPQEDVHMSMHVSQCVILLSGLVGALLSSSHRRRLMRLTVASIGGKGSPLHINLALDDIVVF